LKLELRKTPLLSALPLNPQGPDADAQPPLQLKQILPVPESILSGFPPNTSVQLWYLGECSVLVTLDNDKLLHLSVAHADRDPTWNEISQARYRCLPDNVWMAMYLPPRSEYVNLHRYCFQMTQVEKPED
jgi:hypothetical protein